MKKYDYLIVGAGLYGAVMAYELGKKGKSCLMIDKRDHIAGNIYCEDVEGIHVHKYGAHIFHTSDKKIWDYINQFAEFNHYINSPVAVYKDELYNLPFNMNTFSRMWGIKTPEEAKKIIERQRKESGITEPKNLEEQALFLGGKDIYEKLIKGYTEKQWGRKCTELPAFIIKRLPFRFVYDNNYFNDIDPNIKVETYETFVLPDNAKELLEQIGTIHYIIDAIDTVSAKIVLAELAGERNIPIISSMGTGNKLHAEMFEITDLSKTSVCPLCKVMRKELRNRGITHLKVLYSKEKPISAEGRTTEEEKGMRRTIPGSVSFVPPVAGLLIAGEVIRSLIQAE